MYRYIQQQKQKTPNISYIIYLTNINTFEKHTKAIKNQYSLFKAADRKKQFSPKTIQRESRNSDGCEFYYYSLYY